MLRKRTKVLIYIFGHVHQVILSGEQYAARFGKPPTSQQRRLGQALGIEELEPLRCCGSDHERWQTPVNALNSCAGATEEALERVQRLFPPCIEAGKGLQRLWRGTAVTVIAAGI